MSGVSSRRYGWSLAAASISSVVFLVLILVPGIWTAAFSALFPEQRELLYPRATLFELSLEHLVLVFCSSGLSAIVGVGLGLFLHSSPGTLFRPLGDRIAALGQTFPPAAVLALTVPALGFGFGPTILALFFFGTMPILRGTLAGLDQVPAELRDAGKGMGMNPVQQVLRVEFPIALPYVLAGIRSSVVVNVGTAALGATIGAGGLGVPIISGLVTQNTSFLLEGAIASSLMAIAMDAWFGVAEQRAARK